ncbi:nucleoid-associated protein [Defluviimonas sp. WL0024]|uniref:Nucleoid-associated protein n=1 Tax=Albidovulum salinarum TaxID=2984153 RepID=A0ABT2X8T0_9RHOB|nr:nucleoid-associated protein [Defluviimonas sp. WL0024]MCU9850362.1 nucleoid-associated protein [Defluviimonas sp. WL0024]
MLRSLRVEHVAVHEVFQRGADRRIAPPVYATKLETLSVEALDAFRLRITEALNAKSKCIEMAIRRHGPGTFQGDVEQLVGASAAEFLERSRVIPDRLTEAQTTQNIPGGMVIVFSGTTGPLSSPFVGVIKAEVQDGFRRRKDGAAIITEFVNDLFLTKATRFYKIGFMVRSDPTKPSPDGWLALVFDHKIAASDREAAALYFYETFLGCSFKADAAYETARFFNLTRDFITKSVTDRDKRHDLTDALYTFVKTDKAPTFTVHEFTDRYVPEELQDNYAKFMKGKQFPDRAVQRDTAELTSRLKRRRFKYGTDIEFSASPEAIAQGRATIGTQAVANPETGQADAVTVITILDQFVKEV